MSKKDRKPYFLIAFGVVLYIVLMNLSSIMAFFKNVVSLSLPIVVGFILAFVLNVPMTLFERLFEKMAFFRKFKKSTKHKICLSITLIIIAVIMFLIVKLLVPEFKQSFKSLYETLKVKVPIAITFLSEHGVNTTNIEQLLSKFDFSALTSAGNFVSVIFGFASSVLNIFVTVFIAVVISAYSLVDKDNLKYNSKKYIYAHLKQETASWICEVGKLIKTTYFNFFSGQCIEACILGVFMYVALLIFGIPYAALIALLTAVFAFIPYVGAFLACGVGVVLIILIDPAKAILCLVVYETVQLIENHMIYPHVVGNSVGLSPLWTLVAVVIGGSMFGVVGMIFFIPLMSVVVELLSKDTDKRLKEKNIVITMEEAIESEQQEAVDSEPQDEGDNNGI